MYFTRENNLNVNGGIAINKHEVNIAFCKYWLRKTND